MKLSRWILVGLLGLLACSGTSIRGITPISPRAGLSYWFNQPPAVETLQPTFRWEPVVNPDARYDFIIFESRDGREAAVGREVYNREGLQEPEHTLEVALQPDREYYWSVRVRYGEEVSEWSGFGYQEAVGCGTQADDFPFFLFRTPSE